MPRKRKIFTDVIGLIEFGPSIPTDYRAFYSHGHVPPADFCARVKHEFGHYINPNSVRHILARKIPNRDGGYTFVETSKPGRGAFEATYAENK